MNVQRLGKLSYESALHIQEEIAFALRKKQQGDTNVTTKNTLILLEHYPVYTIGRKDSNSDVINAEQIRKSGADIIKTSRGGKVTFHGPGQLIVYPILNLNDIKKNVKDYVHGLEQVIISTLREFNLEGHTTSDVGVWIENQRKIAAIGVSFSRYVSMHGFALNVNVDLDWYKNIIPCGLKDKEVTSMSKELKRAIAVEEVIPVVLRNFSSVFNVQLFEFESRNKDIT